MSMHITFKLSHFKCFVLQISHHANKQYLNFLPLANATETAYDTMDEAQTYVGNLIRFLYLHALMLR